MIARFTTFARLLLIVLIALGVFRGPGPVSADDGISDLRRMMNQKGAWLFERNCAFCHERDGRGAVGPNLTDWYFIHGPTRENLRIVIENGVIEKGMPVWKSILKPTDMRLIEQYVWSIRGTEKKGKAPEGEHHKPDLEGAE